MSITSPKGFKAAGLACGIKRSGKRDIALIVSDEPATAAAVFTSNKVKAAPIIVSQMQIKGGLISAIVANSGNANCSTGKQGIADARQMIDETALALKLDKKQILVTSTGTIGHIMPMEKIVPGIHAAAKTLSVKGGRDAALAILTTDLRLKEIAVSMGGYSIGAIAKGSGMIAPNMATMHAFITCDAQIERGLLQECLREAVGNSFNMITVDGCMSTNDCVFVLANGVSGVKIASSAPIKKFKQALTDICKYLAIEIARDGEGATKLLEIKVVGAASDKDARAAAMQVANSHLFKAAVFGCDPNWGRIMGALGAAPIKLDQDKVDIFVGPVNLVRNGMPYAFDPKKAHAEMKKKEVRFVINLNLGEGLAEAWGCDLSYDYVKINARYHT